MFIKAASFGALLALAPLSLAAAQTQTTAPAQPAQGQQVIESPNAVMPAFSVSMITPLLDALGRNYTVLSTEAGKQYLSVETAQGLKYFIIPEACDEASPNTGCQAMNITARFPAGIPPQLTMLFDYNQPFISAGLDPENGETWVTRYELAQFGIPRGNVAASIVNFEAGITLFMTRLAQLAEAAEAEAAAQGQPTGQPQGTTQGGVVQGSPMGQPASQITRDEDGVERLQ